MIPLGKSTYFSDKTYDELKSRIVWQVERRKSLIFPNSNSITTDTNKPLVGKTDDEIIVTRVRPYYTGVFPQIFAKVRIESTVTERRISFHYRVGFLTSIFFIFLAFSTFSVFSEFIKMPDNTDKLLDIVIWILIYPGIAILLSIMEANKLKEKLKEILEI